MANMIRMAALSKHIGISSQELRKMLTTVNFGVKATDREVPEALASGIIRFAARKLKKEIPPLFDTEEELTEEEEVQEAAPQKEESKETEHVEQKKEEAPPTAFAELNRLAHKKIEKKEEPAGEKRAGGPVVFRKIEIDKNKVEKAREKYQQDKVAKEIKEQETLEKKAMQRKKKQQQTLVKKEGVVKIPDMVSIKEFSEKVGVPAGEIISVLMKNGMMVTLTQSLDFDTYLLIAEDIEVQIEREEASVTAETLKDQNLEELLKDEAENLQERPPVVVVMGHVDHGKTAILDAIRNTRVIEGEAGGITQHIGAYQVKKNGKLVSFLDTPGHEAFTAMRARGAKTADITILVVASDEGIKPQTIEAINHAKEANLPIIVAINKMDKPDANPDKVKGQLAEHGITVEDWGGDTACVPVSALKKEGIPELIEMVLLQSEMMELKANPNRPAVGTVVESQLDPALGPLATILVNTGTLKVGDDFVLDQHAGRIKTMTNDEGKRIKEAPPGMPVLISGLGEMPTNGSILQVFKNKKIAQQRAEELQRLNESEVTGTSLMDIMEGLKKGDMKFLKIVLKADTEGSLEAVKQAIEKIESTEARPKIIHAAVGNVTETDIMMASASKGLVISFSALLSPRAKRIAEKEKVEVQNYNIIYKLIEDLEKILEGLLEPELVEVVFGTMLVKQIFYTKRKVMIVGCKVEKGEARNKCQFRIYRGEEEEPVATAKITSLQHFEKKVEKVAEGQECGIQIDSPIQLEEGDRLEVFGTEQKMKTL